MNIFQRITSLFRKRGAENIDEQWRDLFGYFPSGLEVNEKTVLGIPTVAKIVKKITGEITALPVNYYRTPLSTNVPEKIDNITTRAIFADRKHLKATLTDYVIRGRGLVFVNRGSEGTIEGLYNLPIYQTTIRQERLAGGFSGLTYTHSAGRQREVYTEAEIIDLVQIPRNQGTRWHDPLHDCRKTFALAIALEDYAEDFFINGLKYVLQSPDPNAERAKEWLRKFNEMREASTKDKSRILAMPHGASFNPMGATPQEARLDEIKKNNRTSLADALNTHPAVLGGLERGNLISEDTQNLFLTQTLLPIIQEVEAEYERAIWPFDTRHKIQFDTMQVARGSLKDTADAQAKFIQSGIYTPNEIRATHYAPPYEYGELAYMQSQLTPVKDLANPPEPVTPPATLSEEPNNADPQDDPTTEETRRAKPNRGSGAKPDRKVNGTGGKVIQLQ